MARKAAANSEIDVILRSRGLKVDRSFVDLLKEIDSTGSLRKASVNLGISYSYAWSLLENYNGAFESPLTVCSGERWKGSELSEKGKEVVAAYDNMWNSFSQTLKDTQDTIFS